MNRNRTCYRFAALADIHIDLENSGKNTYFIHAERNFTRALEVIQRRGCDFIISVGDQVTNASGAVEEWRRYREIIDRSPYRGAIYEALGNHETRFARYGNCTVEDCLQEFITHTRLDQKPVERPAGKPYYAFTESTFGDAFVFMALEKGVDVNRIDNFSDEQMDWAERIIARYRGEGRRIFLIQHAPVCGFGAGDAPAPAYEGSIRLCDEAGTPFVNNRRFLDLIRRERELIWLSGHTHVDFRDNVNYSDDSGRACHMLHIPALAGSTRIITDNEGRHSLDRTFYGDEAQGYIVTVYRDSVVFEGIDFLHDRLYPPITVMSQ